MTDNNAGISAAELEAQDVTAVPDREAMSLLGDTLDPSALLETSLLNVDVDLALDADVAAPIDAAVAANANVAAPIDAARSTSVRNGTRPLSPPDRARCTSCHRADSRVRTASLTIWSSPAYWRSGCGRDR